MTTLQTHPDAGEVLFVGEGSGGQIGIYSAKGAMVTTLVDSVTAVPGQAGNFTLLTHPQLDSGNAMFTGAGSSGQGIYTVIDGAVDVVVDTSDAIPGGSGNFTVFNFGQKHALDGTDVAFIGSGSSGQAGVYTAVGGTLSVVADLNTPVPGGSGNFTAFGNVSMDGGSVAFEGIDGAGQRGVYTNLGGSLEKVITVGDTLDGLIVSDAFGATGASMLSGNTIGFFVRFTDGSKAIYRADL